MFVGYVIPKNPKKKIIVKKGECVKQYGGFQEVVQCNSEPSNCKKCACDRSNIKS